MGYCHIKVIWRLYGSVVECPYYRLKGCQLESPLHRDRTLCLSQPTKWAQVLVDDTQEAIIKSDMYEFLELALRLI